MSVIMIRSQKSEGRCILFGAQGDYWIYARRSSRRQPRCDEGDGGNEQDNSDERNRIGCADSEEKAVQQSGGGKRAGQADDETDPDEHHGVANDEPENGRFSGSERDTDPDFAS